MLLLANQHCAEFVHKLICFQFLSFFSAYKLKHNSIYNSYGCVLRLFYEFLEFQEQWNSIGIP